MKRRLLASLVKPLFFTLPLLFVSCGGDLDTGDNVFETPGEPGRPNFGFQGNPPQNTAPAATNPAMADKPASDMPPSSTDAAPAGNPPAPASTAPNSSSAVASTDPAPAPAGTPPAPTTKPKPADTLPFGVPVIGKKGFVYSPFAMEKGMVDVSELASGTKVECPYTFKHFRVP
jgi:hypothetical protein